MDRLQEWGFEKSFQTTYEELKLTIAKVMTNAERPRFQTTYEELKLSSILAGSALSAASRLPMRN